MVMKSSVFNQYLNIVGWQHSTPKCLNFLLNSNDATIYRFECHCGCDTSRPHTLLHPRIANECFRSKIVKSGLLWIRFGKRESRLSARRLFSESGNFLRKQLHCKLMQRRRRRLVAGNEHFIGIPQHIFVFAQCIKLEVFEERSRSSKFLHATTKLFISRWKLPGISALPRCRVILMVMLFVKSIYGILHLPPIYWRAVEFAELTRNALEFGKCPSSCEPAWICIIQVALFCWWQLNWSQVGTLECFRRRRRPLCIHVPSLGW